MGHNNAGRQSQNIALIGRSCTLSCLRVQVEFLLSLGYLQLYKPCTAAMECRVVQIGVETGLCNCLVLCLLGCGPGELV